MVSTLIFIISLLGFILALILVLKERKTPGICPKFSVIPACYIVSFAYVFIVISGVFTLRWLQELFFWSGSIIGLILGIWFSFHNINGNKKCPKFFFFPLCYDSSVVFLLLIILKLFM